ncbi:sensor histidine kinase [Gordoniibacillus kamchatkensis]|uniref:sensor histidine kinase n=1 Tax=Gordoniibacillus kamchatkensis TaxID=1590651 RepID=UPI00069825F9|nr:histidine kinase [Paenibacillus sp. VKM B-2647]
MYKYGHNTVFSLARPIHIPGTKQNTIYVYIETNLKLFEEILYKQQYGMKASHIIFNQKGTIAYSDDEREFPIGTASTAILDIKNSEHYFFSEKSNQGWSIAVAIRKADFEKEFRKLLLKIGGIALFCLAISIVLALLLWRTVYRPLKSIHKEIRFMADSKFNSTIKLTRITEFDYVLDEFLRARNRILELFGEIEQKERIRAQLEVEKLLYQINPHFIHNTLNTIQWLARMEGHQEIDRLVSIFTRVLHYNLGKDGGVVPLIKEVEALKDYVALQRIRYDYDFDVRFEVDERLANVTIPRFILQPLVENALYHGLKDDKGTIEVTIRSEDNAHVVIQVRDSGNGMAPNQIQALLADDASEEKKVGLGIGLRYVLRTIKAHYGDSCQFHIDSRVGQGTAITLLIPIEPEEQV